MNKWSDNLHHTNAVLAKVERKFELMQIRVERPSNRVWVTFKIFFELNNSSTMDWGK